MHLAVHVNGAVLKFVFYTGHQDLYFLHAPVQHTGEERKSVRFDGLKHGKLLITTDLLESPILGPRREWDL